MPQLWQVGSCEERMLNTRKRELGGAQLGQAHPKCARRPGVDSVKETLRSNAGLLQTDLYLNPDPLCRLIGEPNKTQVKLEGQKFNAFVDSGLMVSQITISLAKALKLEIKQLQTLIPMEGAGGINIPYLGYLEATLDVPEVEAFNEDCLFLVISDHMYGKRVPIMIGTLHIDLIIEKATKDELDKVSITWGRGQLFRQIQARQVQLTNQNELEKVQGTIKLTKKVKLKPNQTLKVSGKGTHPLNSRRVNVIVESIDEEYSEYTIPSYSFLKLNSK